MLIPTYKLSLFVSSAPRGPPMNVKVFIHSSSSILVSWSHPVGVADAWICHPLLCQ